MEDRIRESQTPLTAEREGNGAEAVLNETTAEKLTELLTDIKVHVQEM